ncbi:MAG: cupin domain-containing protein [Gaiellaceae bacterium MAG52_C11]|nr:cupin domain-containing protein [Candidatus Gaiellasilicea maunaloa]
MRSFNLFDGELDESRDQPGFSWRRAKVGERIGAEKLGASLYELQPGERTFPYHYEYGNEEWLLVVVGRPTLRDPNGERELRPGDLVCFPEGPEGAHQIRNATDEPVRILVASTKVQPDAAVYPDSGKIGIWTGNEAESHYLFRIEDDVDYWDGEGGST